HKSPITLTDTSRIDFYYNASTSNRVITLPQPMIDVKGTKYSTSITLLPYTSAVLMVDPNPASPAVPVYTGSLISASTPAVLEISYNLTLATSAPSPSAFAVNVNSTARSVSSVAISGTKVLLTLSSPVSASDAVTVAYTRPSTNPVQTPSGGVAASFTAQPVNNLVSAPVPVYVSSVVQNAAPAVVEMTYSLALANIVPSTSAFDVRANGVNRPVGSVAIASDKVRLTLTYPLIYGDVVTVTYNAPSSNPLQTPSGGRAASISARPVTNNISPPYPVFVSASVENSTPTILSMVYSLSLASVIPATSAFTVTVNSVARTVNSVAISGTRVNLTLASRVNSGDVVTVAYTKPSVSPLQTSAGSQAESLAARSVTNNVLADIPVYVSSVVNESAPAVIEITYNLSLANVVPATSAFSVLVNSVARSVTGVSIVNGKVLLTLASRVYEGDAVLFSYTKPATSPLQTALGGQAASISSRTVTNNTGPATPVFVSAVVENATPSNIDISYNIALTGIVPATSAFAVTVNGSPRSVGSVAIVSGKARLTLSSPVVVGDVITVSYTRPASNPLQTIYGGIADSYAARSVTNRCVAPVPVFTSASVEDSSPSIIAIGFDLSLANVVPGTSAFNVMVNSVSRTVISVAIVGGRALLVLESPVEYGNIVTVSYTKPATLALQTPSDGEVASFSARQVTNNCLPPVPTIQNAVVEDATPSVIEITFNTPLAATVPSFESFTLLVNAIERPVVSVSIVSGKLRFTLASPLLYGDLVRISYTSPEANYLQSTAGIKAPDFSGVPVTNNILPILPDFTGAFVRETSPGTIVVTFDMVMANVIPAPSSFTVLV
ncbi:MAG: SwmB domain-containing protein, partial [Bacteroidales bacterium]|nr:SwmB domain-containing protein [Bacteroidales bacterium]